MYEFKKFDVEIVRSIANRGVSWPAAGEATDDGGLGGNREYMDFRRIPWSEAIRVHELEGEIIARLERSDDPEAEYTAMEAEWDEEPAELYGLDIGVASTVVALSSVRCIPFSSCNAGSFGGRHLESYPLVAFHARRHMLDLLLECAEHVGIGLELEDMGILVAYATDVGRMRAFADALIRRRRDFRALRAFGNKISKGSKSGPSSQLKLLGTPCLDDGVITHAPAPAPEPGNGKMDQQPSEAQVKGRIERKNG
jgi:hypothetical protein